MNNLAAPPAVFPQESTYGTHIHEKREEREARFCNTVHDIVNREGRCLIPVFALGRAQELLLILGEAPVGPVLTGFILVQIFSRLVQTRDGQFDELYRLADKKVCR